MLKVHQIVNSYQHSCTYILYQEDCEHVWLVDCGGAEAVESWLRDNKKRLKGVFLTHCHNDHTNGLREIIKLFPDVKVCLSAHEGIKCVQDIRLNLSKYTPEPFQIFSDYFVEGKGREYVAIFTCAAKVKYKPTPTIFPYNLYSFRVLIIGFALLKCYEPNLYLK